MGFGIFWATRQRLECENAISFMIFNIFSIAPPDPSCFTLQYWKQALEMTGFWHFHLSLGLHCRSCRDIISQCLQWDVCSQAPTGSAKLQIAQILLSLSLSL